jgi:hypothetical protein
MGGLNESAGGSPDPIDDEFKFHVAACAAELERAGRSPEDARSEAERRFGPSAVHHRACRREAPEERMERVMRWTLATIAVVLAVATATLGTVAWKQSRQLVELGREPAAETIADAATRLPPGTGWVSIEGDGLPPRCIGIDLGESGLIFRGANRIVYDSGASTDVVPFRITVVPRKPSVDRLKEWRDAGKAVVQVDGLEAVTYVRDPRTWSGPDFPLMSGDRIIVSHEADGIADSVGAKPVDACVAAPAIPYWLDGDVPRPGVYEGGPKMGLMQLVTIAGGYTGPAGSRVEIRVRPREQRIERAQAWLQAGGRVDDADGIPTLVHQGPTAATCWNGAPAIVPGDVVTVRAAR